MKCVSALSTVRNTESAIADVIGRASEGLAGEAADLALVFSSTHHAEALGRLAAKVRGDGLARHVLGCTGETIVGEDSEVEDAPALSLWAIQLPGVTLTRAGSPSTTRAFTASNPWPPPARRRP